MFDTAENIRFVVQLVVTLGAYAVGMAVLWGRFSTRLDRLERDSQRTEDAAQDESKTLVAVVERIGHIEERLTEVIRTLNNGIRDKVVELTTVVHALREDVDRIKDKEASTK